LQGARAALSAARSQVAEARTAITTTESQRIEAGSAIDTAQTVVKRIQADINDAALKSPRDGRMQYASPRPGEVLGAGGRVLNWSICRT
jgi:HlyD family secretion protein